MTRDRTWIALAAFAALAVFGVLARPPLPIDETRYLAVAWEMRTGGDWLVPHLNGAPYSHKPPMLFWLMNLVWTATGVSGTAARLVGPAFGLGAIWATARLARRLWPEDEGVGGRAAMVLAGLGAFAVFAGLTMFDAMLMLAVIAGVFAILAAGEGRGARIGLWIGPWIGPWIGLGAALAFGALAKGPVILVHLLPLALTSPLWAGVAPRRALAGRGIALGVGGALVGLWLAPAALLGGEDYRRAVLWTQSAGRMTESFAHARPWWFFLALVPLLVWPFGWSAGLWRRLAARGLRADPGLRLAAIWTGSALLLFSLMSGKQAHYLLPALPAVALAFARAMGSAPLAAEPASSSGDPAPLSEARMFAPLSGRKTLAPLSGAVAAPAAALPLAGIGVLCLAAAFGVPPGPLGALLGPPAVAGGIGLGFLALALLGLRLRGPGLAWMGLGAAALADLGFLLGAPGAVYDAGAIAALVAPADEAGVGVLGKDYQGEFTFAARLRRPVATLSAQEAEAWLAADPGRALVARLDRDRPAGPPRAAVIYRNHAYGVWGGPHAVQGAQDVALD